MPLRPLRLARPLVLVALVGASAPAPAAPGVFDALLLSTSREARSGREWYARGMDRHESRRYDAAIEAFQKAIELGYREEAASYNIACGYALKGDAERAFEWLEKALAAGFDLEEYLEEDDDLDGLKGDPRFAALRERLGTAPAEPSDGDAAGRTKALARFDRLAAESPRTRHGHDYYEVGRALLAAREYDRAAEAFQASAGRGYRPASSLYNTACSYSLKGDKGAALDFLSRALEAGFDDPEHIDRDDDLDAIRGEPRFRELRQAAEELELPGAVDRWWGRFVGESFGPDWHEHARRYRSYARRHPQSGRAFFNLGYASLQLEEPERARDAFKKALELGYRKSTTMYNLACAHARLREKDAAFDWLFKAIAAGFDSKGHLTFDRDLASLRGDPRFRKARQLAER